MDEFIGVISVNLMHKNNYDHQTRKSPFKRRLQLPLISHETKLLYSYRSRLRKLSILVLSLICIYPVLAFVHVEAPIYVLGFPLAILHLILIGITLLLSWKLATSGRKSQSNWESFLLTGIDARTVVHFRWSAVVQQLWREYILIGIAYSGVFLNSKAFASVSQTILIAALTVVIMFLQLWFITSCGILGASINIKSSTNFWRTITTYLLINFGTVLLLLLSVFIYGQYAIYLYRSGIDTTLFFSEEFAKVRDIHLMTIALITDGVAFSVFWVFDSLLETLSENLVGIVSLIATAILYIGWTWCSLQLSIKCLSWQGMLPNDTSSRGKLNL